MSSKREQVLATLLNALRAVPNAAVKRNEGLPTGGVKLEMQKIDKFAHAAKVVALCLPPVVMSLIGLAALSRRKGGAAVAGGKASGGVRSERALRDSP
jgi:hypothetical protein